MADAARRLDPGWSAVLWTQPLCLFVLTYKVWLVCFETVSLTEDIGIRGESYRLQGMPLTENEFSGVCFRHKR
jgi:hypothetical protein